VINLATIRAEARALGMSDFQDFGARLLAKDGTLFSTDPETISFINRFLGWVDSPRRTLAQLPEIRGFASEVRDAGFTDAVVCGMGGSSLSSLVWASVFPRRKGLKLHVLDSTHPGEIARVLNGVNHASTLWIIASKSGTTVEPLAMENAVWEALGGDASKIVAITDPGSEMHQRAEARGYRKVFLGEPEIGGRFSAFSVFGIVPAALGGLDVEALLLGAIDNLESLGSADRHEPGLLVAVAAKAGVDKLTLLTSPQLDALGLWLEQLIAESTGKGGFGVLPLATEPKGRGEDYGDDRFLWFLGTSDPSLVEEHLNLTSASLTGEFSERDLGRVMHEAFVSTAAMGKVLGVNPFDQPNVQEAKDIARAELAKVQASGAIVLPDADASDDIASVAGAEGDSPALALAEFLNHAMAGDHVAFLAYLVESDDITGIVQEFRTDLRHRLGVATSFGYGPRYLHSTGQYHKGGPNHGHFVVITQEIADDQAIPEMGVSFGQLCTAQALGDLGALKANDRRALHVHLKGDAVTSLRALFEGALRGNAAL
jgi:glucose-6-phosphate isomerase